MSEVYPTYFIVEYVVLISYAIQMIPWVLDGISTPVLMRFFVYIFTVLVQVVECDCYMAQKIYNSVKKIHVIFKILSLIFRPKNYKEPYATLNGSTVM